MKNTLLRGLFFGLLFCFTASSVWAQGIWYVNSSNTSVSQDGKNWSSAFNSLQSALSVAKSGDSVWVAQGIYYPSLSDQNIAFNLKPGVALYGGFRGNERELSQRNYEKYQSVLSGNIGHGNKTKNTVTIVKGADGAILDGFIIKDAYAEGKAALHLVRAEILKNNMKVGGGMRNFMVSPIVRNCIFENNYSAKGGAVYNVQESMAQTQATFINVTFINNTAEMRGGAVSNDLGAMPVFINCKFINNRSLDKGGALYNDFASSPRIFNSLFESNSAITAGAIGNDGGSSPLLVNVTMRNNLASSGMGSGLYQGTGTNNNPLVINTLIDDSLYNWHEDTVVVLNSDADSKSSILLKDFIHISNLQSSITESDLEQFHIAEVGYNPQVNGLRLLKNPLIHKLNLFYQAHGGEIYYNAPYILPALNVTKTSESIIYVVATSVSSHPDGKSWASAYSDLQQAIKQAAVNGGAEIWLAKGIYAPQARKESQIAAFVLYDNVKLYGGFNGNERYKKDRDPIKNITILSAKASSQDYFYPHVLYGANGAILDGLVIRDGKATGFTYNGNGGGLLAYQSGKIFHPHDDGIGFTMTIKNCRFENNQALAGGAIYAYGKAKLTLSNNLFISNTALYGGAIMDREGNQLDGDKCLFEHNFAEIDGGAVYADYGSKEQWTNSEFTDNSAKYSGGAFYVISRASQLGATQVNVDNSIFSGNTALIANDLMNFDNTNVNFSNDKLAESSTIGKVAYKMVVK